MNSFHRLTVSLADLIADTVLWWTGANGVVSELGSEIGSEIGSEVVKTNTSIFPNIPLDGDYWGVNLIFCKILRKDDFIYVVYL